jgi:hypothetical protein
MGQTAANSPQNGGRRQTHQLGFAHFLSPQNISIDLYQCELHQTFAALLVGENPSARKVAAPPQSPETARNPQ